MNENDEPIPMFTDDSTENLIALCINTSGICSTERRKYMWQLINNLRPSDYLNLKSLGNEDFEANKNERIVYMDCERYTKFHRSDSDGCEDRSSSSHEDPLEVSAKSRMFVEELYDMIMRVLCDNKNLVYYQGFHDIATVLLMVMGHDDGTLLLRILAKNQLKDFMSPDFHKTTDYLDLVVKLIEINDYELYQFMKRSNVGSVFCLSWILTWFAHNVKSFSLVCRLFDFFMVTNKYMSVYVASTLVMGVRDEIMELECDMATVHSFLSRIPERITQESWERSIEGALQLFDRFPPESVFITGFGYFSYSFILIFTIAVWTLFRTLILVGGWSRKRTNKTLLKNSILNGTAKCIRKGFKRRSQFQPCDSSSSSFLISKEFWSVDKRFLVVGFSLLIVAIGVYTYYPYENWSSQ